MPSDRDKSRFCSYLDLYSSSCAQDLFTACCKEQAADLEVHGDQLGSFSGSLFCFTNHDTLPVALGGRSQLCGICKITHALSMHATNALSIHATDAVYIHATNALSIHATDIVLF